MSNRIFIWDTSLDGNSGTNSFKVLTSQFGDGYEQNISVGINNKHGTWPFNRKAIEAVILEIKNFLDEHKGADSFIWNSPKDGQVRVKAGDYQITDLGSNLWQISTTFTQVFYP